MSDPAGENVGVVAHDRFLRQALGDVGGDAAGILAHKLDLLAGDAGAVLLHIKLDGVVHLRRGVGELAGIAHDERDLDRARGSGRVQAERRQRDRDKPAASHQELLHCSLPVLEFVR